MLRMLLALMVLSLSQFCFAADGPPFFTVRQSFGSFLTINGTLMIRWHSGHGDCLPSSSADTFTGSAHIGQLNSMNLVSTTGAGVFSSANAC